MLSYSSLIKKSNVLYPNERKYNSVFLSPSTINGFLLAIGLNINFFTLVSEFDANIYFGGDNVIFWGPLAKTVIYGLFVATFLTLIVVPIMFYLVTRFKMWLQTKMSPSTTLIDLESAGEVATS